MPIRALAAGIAAFLSIVASSLDAYAVAPRAEWRTVLTPRCRVHFHEGLEGLGPRVAAIAEEVLPKIGRALGHLPAGPIHLVLTDESDEANGFASVRPDMVVILLVAVPEPGDQLSDYDDYLRLLVIHELTHVVHLDMVGGLPAAIDDIFGRVFFPNELEPSWLIEGIAVWLETELTSAGRNRSPYVDMLVRALVLGPGLPPLDELSNRFRRFPDEATYHTFGGRFVEHLAKRHGADAVARFAAGYGERLLPYGLNLVAEEAAGETWESLWRSWEHDAREDAERLLAPARAEGLRTGERPAAIQAEDIRRPRAKGGVFVAVESPRTSESEYVVRGSAFGPVRARFRCFGRSAVPTPDGTRLVAEAFDTYRRARNHADLEVIDLATGRRRRLTYGARLTEPDVAPDGHTIAATIDRGPIRAIALLDTDSGDPPRVVIRPGPGEQLGEPAWSPDGSAIALVKALPSGARKLVLHDRRGAFLRDLTDGTARDGAPVWSPDGAKIAFVSDRGGISNVFTVEVATGAIAKRSNVETGALEPAWDGGRIAFVMAGPEGFELRVLPEDAPRSRADPPPARPEALATHAPEVHLPIEAYSPWEALIPKAWLPTSGLTSGGDVFGIFVAGEDALAAHSYELRLDYQVDPKVLGYSASYSNRQLPVALNISSSLAHTRRARAYALPSGMGDRPESIWRLRFGIDLPLGRSDAGHSVGIGYGVEVRRRLEGAPRDPFFESPGPGDLTLAPIELSWRYSNLRGGREIAGSSRGMAMDISVRVNHERLGSSLRTVDVSAHWTGFTQAPWADSHVFAARLAGGLGTGDTQGRAFYTLGGLPARDILTDAIDGVSFGADVIRGYEVASLGGRAFYLASVEYRVPVWKITTGYATIPVFVDRLHAAAFFDCGDAMNGAPRLESVRTAAGAELRLDVALGYYLPMVARFGYGRGFAEDGIHDVYLVLGGGF